MSWNGFVQSEELGWVCAKWGAWLQMQGEELALAGCRGQVADSMWEGLLVLSDGSRPHQSSLRSPGWPESPLHILQRLAQTAPVQHSTIKSPHSEDRQTPD